VLDGAILVHVLTRQASGVTAAVLNGGVVPLAFFPFGDAGKWGPTDVDLTAFGNREYWVTTLGGGDTLFLPKQAGLSPRRARFYEFDGRLYGTAMDTLAPTNLSPLQGLVLAGASMGTGYALAIAPSGWDWLQRVSFGGGAGALTVDLRNSVPVSMRVSVQGNCNERGCEGCPDVQVQRMCLAYSKCALVNCVGTPVHQRKPLCGVGALLKHTGQMALTSTEAAWTVFAEMLGLVLDLSLLSLREAHLLWPEDRFLCHVCAAKDGSAEFFSILTSILNTALQLGRANVGYLYGGASNVDRNADAVLTVSNTALNAFMHQIALAPLFAMVATHQVMMCQTQGLLALVSRGDTFRVSLLPADQGTETDAIAGQCLTLGAAAMAQFPTDDPKGLGAIVAATASNAVQQLLVQQIEPLVHYMDTALAYGIGVVQSFGRLVMSQNMAKCNPPDFNLRDVVTCACGDQPLGIQAARRVEGVPERAHWCSGVLSMLDGDGRPIFVYNPYTYAQVQALAAGMQAYLDCLRAGTAGYTCAPPTDPVFQAQGVNALNVLVACRDNFVKRRWDPAAFVLYHRLPGYPLRYPGLVPVPQPDACGIRECMREESAAIGALSKACLERHLQCAALTDDDYWQYEHVPVQGAPEYTDACLVFYGPAQAGAPPFEPCVDGPDEGSCTLPAHCWTPLSSNNVPVCEQHRVLSAGAHRDGVVQRLYARARRLVQDAVRASVAHQTGGASRANASLFSVEGDVLHQTMDCIFMGPYARVDYWPLPSCGPGEECLDGPYWARDEGGGATRAVDLNACPSETDLPYTCGSTARRALMRYFVNDFLESRMSPNSNGSLVREILLRTLEGHAQDWADTGRFGCPCADRPGEALPSCCRPGGPLLPPWLDRNFTSIPTQHVLTALDDDFRDIARLAVDDIAPFRKYLDRIRPGTSAGWDWRGSRRAEDEARLSPVGPSLSYGPEEAQTPFLFTNSTLWDTCHAALKQVLFTLPLDGTGLRQAPVEMFDGNASRIEEYIGAFTAEAFLNSPLYRHYSPRHAPSDSAMCRAPQSSDQAESAAGWDDFVQGGTTLLNRRSAVLPPLPSYRPQRFRVGEEACLCGWARGPLGCQAPPSACPDVCQKVACAQGCWYRPSDEPAVLEAFRPEWSCPEAELSPHWGVLDAAAMEDWLARNETGASLSTRELLTHGRAGLRIGNLEVLKTVSKQYVAPNRREIPLDHGRLTTCPAALAAWGSDYTERFVDQLFPAAQGVESAGSTAYCLRYAIEVARLTVLNLTLPSAPETQAQREAVQRWRARCGAQLQAVHLCASLDMYRPRTSLSIRACPHFTVRGLAPGDYTTPECLVRVAGEFHDPCRCLPCEGRAGAQISVKDFAGRPECLIRFDPRRLLTRGLPIGWVDGRPPQSPEPPPGFMRALLEDPDAVGNTNPDEPWWQAEGWMADNSEFCDMVQDWWPDDWDYPVGYHVTVPCDAGDTAYRSFVQAFALDDSGPEPRMVYQHDLLRDAGLVDTHFGVGGLCRATSFGMPMPVTNTMRYCTAPPLAGEEDFTMPGPRATQGAYADFRCTQTHTDLPWPDASSGPAPYDASLRSVGTVPGMPPPDSPVYPASADSMRDVGPWQEIVRAKNDWGPACSDYPLYMCAADPDCQRGFTCRGRVCSNDLARACAADGNCSDGGVCRGVCLDSNTECIRHSDCDGDRMCTGVGTCELPTVVVSNDLPTPASFRLATQGACPNGSRPFSLLGGSHWAYTSDDLLRAHGMCSYEDWFKYTYGTLARCQTGGDAASIQVNPSACPIINLEASGASNTSTWWSPSKQRPDFMYLRPTNCDRDHERLAGFQQCAPTADSAVLIDTLGPASVSSDLAYDQFVRLHESRTSMRLARMPEASSVNLGFLGLGVNYTSLKPLQASGDHPFVSCGSLSQCYEPDFYVRGRKANRTLASGDPYPPDAYFSCGSFGYPDPVTKRCVLDTKAFPLYRFLCDPGTQIQSCTELLGTAQITLCLPIALTYDAQNTQRTAQLRALTELFYAFPSFTDLWSYLQTTRCMSDLHAALGGDSLYFPFMYSLYEFPFDWFYQCMVMMPGVRVDVTARGNQDCEQFANRARVQIGAYTPQNQKDSWLTYVRRVRGGYLWADYLRFVAQQSESMANRTRAARENAQHFYYNFSSTDGSMQKCSVNMIWDIGPYGQARTSPYDVTWRALIHNFYDAQTCQPTWEAQLVQRAKDAGTLSSGDTSTTWIRRYTLPDPNKLAVPVGADTTMLAEIARYMVNSGKAVLLDVSTGNEGCIGYNSTVPADASESRILQDFPDLRLQTDQMGQLASRTGDNSDLTCVFQPQDDDAFAPSRPVSCANVQLKTQGLNTIYAKSCTVDGKTKVCSLVPTAYRYGGYFACHYPVQNKEDGMDTGSAESVLTFMYARVRRSYLLLRAPGGRLQATPLPWFARDWPFDGFDLSDVLDFQNNVQPNPNKAVMCTINTNVQSATQFMRCQSPHYAAIKAHALGAYKRDGPVIVPSRQQLEWRLGRSALTQGVLLSYANQNRTRRQLYMDSLFDDARVCTDSAMSARVCWRNTTGVFTPMNPWLLGNFNPYSMCDVEFSEQSQQFTETVFSACNSAGTTPNPACAAYDERWVRQQCRDLAQTVVPQPGVPPLGASERLGEAYTFLDYNLCKHTLVEDSRGCMEDQGLLGGHDGLPVAAPPSSYSMIRETKYEGATYRVAAHLYEESEWGIPDDFRGGLLSGTNPLWAGGEGPYGHLRADEDELGGHRVALRISKAAPADAISRLLVERAFLSSGGEGVPVDASGSLPASAWVPDIRASMAADHASNQRLYQLVFTEQSMTSPSCPLQRWAFYSGGYPAFSPTLPSPQRSRHLFYRIHRGLFAHPTMQQTADGRNIGAYRTANGFCACPVVPDIEQPQCLVPVGASSDCSLLSTVQLLAGLTPYLTSKAFTPLDSNLRPRPCTMQLDWPNVNNTLRDGTAFGGNWAGASSVTGRLCHVLDRLQPFRYRYVSATTLAPSGLNANRAGVCQTARAVVFNGSATIPQGRCVRTVLAPADATIACTSTASTFRLPRRTPLTPAQTAARWRARRQRCSACSPPPAFTTQAGAPIPPESSFGRLFRPSTERMLAKDLRDTLCGATGTCPPFNRSAWARGRFLDNYLHDPAALFLWQEPPSHQQAPSPKKTPETDAAWEGEGWVLCPDARSLREGAGCKGTIPRQIWERDRAGTCARMVRSFYNSTAANDPMARAPFCNVDQTTSAVCAAIVEARALVGQANCIASGEAACMPQPYVYHPATYDASNNQWVRDTVTSFYQQINASLCPATGEGSEALYRLTRAFQEECPATSVNLLVTFMRILRTVLTDVALLLSTMASMVVKLLAMLVQDPAQVRSLKQAAGADWALIKRKAGAAMASAADMLLDGMLNSGSAGKGLMQFLSRACEQINRWLEWFVGVWCTYVKQYMISLLLALQRLVGMIGSGFEIVNDLMDYLFAGILPAQLAAKYGNQMFQNLMQERYSRPTAHKDKVAASKNVPTAADLRPVDGGSAARNSRIEINRNSKLADRSMDLVQDTLGVGGNQKGSKSMLKSVGGKAGLLGAALAAYQIVDGIIDLKNTLGNYYPENFTLFDLSDIVNSISDMVQYLQQDSTCYRYEALQRANMSYSLFPCFRLDMGQYGPSADAGTTSITASLCWADAQPSLGQNSLLSCSAGSTCCRTGACTEFILCESCPATLPGINRYGCDGLRQQCVCGQPVSAVSTCSSNGQCGTDAQCTLASSRAGISYGTIPCALCPATEQVMCMLPLSGLPGQCSCALTASLQYDLCAGPTGSRTIVDPNRVCGYVPGYSVRATSWAFGLDDIMLVSCAQAEVGVCAAVTPPGQPPLQMVMAASVRTRGARRLLSFDDPDPVTAGSEEDYASLDPGALELVLRMDGWDATWDPCRSLVAAHSEARTLGVMDEYELRRCAYWRFVGHRIVTRYNLTALEDTFLVSWGDLAQTLLEPSRARALLGALPAMARAALYHPWLRPVRAMGMDLLAALEERRWARVLRADQAYRAPRPGPSGSMPASGSRGRRLLQAAQSVQADIQGVIALSVQVIRGAPSTGTRVWTAGDPSASSFVWPPVYNYSLSACPIGRSVLRLGSHVAFVQKMYYVHFDDIRQPPIDRSLRGTLPSLPPLPANASVVRRAGGWVSSGFHTLLAALGTSPSALVAFLTSDRPDGLRWLLGTAVECDLASVNTCSRHKRDLLMSVVVFALAYAAATTVGNALGFPLAGTLMLLSFPSFILWYTFGVGPGCFPLLPTCLLSDIVAAVQYAAPAQILMPRALLDGEGLVPCERLGFVSWQDTLVFAMCDTDRQWCESLAVVSLPVLDGPLADFRAAVARLGGVMDAPAYDPAPYRVCAWVSFVWVLPAAALALAVLTLAFTAGSAAIGVLPSLTQFVGQTAIFYNTPA